MSIASASPASTFDRVVEPTFILDIDICRDLHVTSMTLHRWDHDPGMQQFGWPVKVRIARKNCREAELYRAFKDNLVKRALAERSKTAA